MTDQNEIKRRIHELTRIREQYRKLVHRYEEKNIEIGDFTYAYDLRIIRWYRSEKVHIGKFCSIADGVKILTGGEHHTDWCTTYPFDVIIDGQQTLSHGDVWIGNDVWIGMDAKILSGVTIGDGAVIAAGAVVADDVKPYTIVGGVPARLIRPKVMGVWATELLRIAWWDWPLQKIAEAIPMLCSRSPMDIIRFDKEYEKNDSEKD